jgi:TIR domain-containing protein
MRTIFLSYAHDDNRAPEGGNRKGWVNFFDESLDIELSERVVNARLWRDKRDFDPMGVVNDTLKTATSTSDLLLAVLSPRYVEQKYTNWELNSFVESKTTAGLNDAANRILLVLKRSLPEDKYPTPIRGMGYVPFFEVDRQSNEEKPYFDGFGNFISQQYWESIRKVASLIKTHLDGLDARSQVKANGKQAAKRAGVTVFLAATTSDLGDHLWSVRKELESQGCRVVPDETWPSNADAARRHLQDSFAAADFSIHLLGATSGSDAASGLTDLAKLQLDLAAERAAKNPKFRRFIWLKTGMSASEPAQKALIDSLDDGTSLLAQDELIRSGLENLKEVVRDELTRHGGTEDVRPLRLYVVCDAADEDDALALRPALTQAGFEPEVPESGPDGQVSRQDHERALAACDAVLVYWGKGTESQARQRLDDIDGAVATLRQGRPFGVRGLYLGAPPSARKTTFASHFVDVVVPAATALPALAAFAQNARSKGRQ